MAEQWAKTKDLPNRFARQIEAGSFSTYRVCYDCYSAHHYGRPADWSDREPLSLVPDTAEVSDGLLESEHSEHCTPADREEGCDCGTYRFSSSACDGCGQTDAGERHALTVVYDMRDPEGE